MESLKELYKIGNGPSSSHSMGPKKCAEYVLNKYGEDFCYKVFLYHSLALTGKGHLTDYVIRKTLKNVEIIFDIDTVVPHPNTLDIYVYKNTILIDSIRFFSIGGGSIEIAGKENNKLEEPYKETNFFEIKEFCEKNQINLAQYVYLNEGDEIKEYLSLVYDKMKSVIDNGMQNDGVLPGSLKVKRRSKELSVPIEAENELVKETRLVSCYAFAVAEENASGSEIVIAPTCGSSGVLPSVLKYLEEKYHFSKEKMIDALAVAGIIGNVIKRNASISGAECGCQAEIGSATSMAAGFHAFLFDYTIDQIEYAAEIGLEHQLGLTCDPIRGYVQIPCIERNAVAALRAISSSTIAYFLAGSRKISFDYVVKTMKETGKDIHTFYKETSLGGLAKDYIENDK